MNKYPYDPDLREYITKLLYDAIPALYKLEDERAKYKRPPDPAELEEFIKILAAPLAVVRQSIEELYGDLFIDSAQDWVLPYLAQMVGTSLVFPEADANRRDIRATVSWRQRKGTPAMLQELGNNLTGQLVVTQEGWQRIQMTQDLNLQRLERTVPLIRSAAIAEQVVGPLDTLDHAVDARPITQRTGRYHPKQVTHWVHPTEMFPVIQGTPADLRDPTTDPDLRFAFHPLGRELPLRCRRANEQDRLKSDRTPPKIFGENPHDWFGREGRFDVRIAGLTAAIAAPQANHRFPVSEGASSELIAGTVALRLLAHEERRFTGAVTVAVMAVPLSGLLPNVAAAEVRSRFEIDTAGASSVTVENGGNLTDVEAVAMVRLTPVGVSGRRFPGAVIEITGGTASARLGARNTSLAQSGFLRGALIVEIPETLIVAERWFYLAADGSLFEAQSSGTGIPDLGVTEIGPPASFIEEHRRSTGPGPAWPPLPFSLDARPWNRLPAAPGAGPIVMHGGEVLTYVGTLPEEELLNDSSEAFVPAAAGETFALTFALTYWANGRQFEPMLRLRWNGSDSTLAIWEVLGTNGDNTDSSGNPIDLGTRLRQIAEMVSVTDGVSLFDLFSGLEPVLSAGVTALRDDQFSLRGRYPSLRIDASSGAGSIRIPFRFPISETAEINLWIRAQALTSIAIAGVGNVVISGQGSFVRYPMRLTNASEIELSLNDEAVIWLALIEVNVQLGGADGGLAVRFESSQPNAIMAPAEIAFTAYDGRSVLIHTPNLVSQLTPPDPAWPTDTTLFPHQSIALTVGQDGSTWRTGTTINQRQSLGAIAPLRSPVTLQRRRIHGRSLCQWRNEVPPDLMHGTTPPGRLDIDAAHGLFSMSASEPPQSHPPESGGTPSDSLAVVYQEGYTAHMGARPATREPALNQRLPLPTRIVSASGHLPEGSPAEWFTLPTFPSLGDALNAIAIAPQTHEVIQIVDNATYRAEVINWPEGPEQVTIQAAERTRPILEVSSWSPGTATYARLSLTGVALFFAPAGAVTLPAASEIEIRYCSLLQTDATLVFDLTEELPSPTVLGQAPLQRQITILNSIMAGLSLLSSGELIIKDSIVDVGTATGVSAIAANNSGQLNIQRSTILGTVTTTILDASETIFMNDVTVEDRFKGCVRYSRVTSTSTLPKQHRLAVDTKVKFLSFDRHDPAHLRLAADCDPAVLKGAEDGGEMGVFHQRQLAQGYEAYSKRLREYTPAGLVSNIVRLD